MTTKSDTEVYLGSEQHVVDKAILRDLLIRNGMTGETVEGVIGDGYLPALWRLASDGARVVIGKCESRMTNSG